MSFKISKKLKVEKTKSAEKNWATTIKKIL